MVNDSITTSGSMCGWICGQKDAWKDVYQNVAVVIVGRWDFQVPFTNFFVFVCTV